MADDDLTPREHQENKREAKEVETQLKMGYNQDLEKVKYIR